MPRILFTLILALVSTSALASTTSVVPTAVIASENTTIEKITLFNRGDEPVKFQMKAMSLAADGSTAETQDLKFSPSIVEIPANDKRVVRIVRSKTGAGFYQIVAREIPAPFNPNAVSVQLIATHIMPVAFQPAGEPQLSASVEGGKLKLTNSGQVVARIAAYGPVGAKPVKEGALGWVLPGTSRLFDYASPPSQIDVKHIREVKTLQVGR